MSTTVDARLERNAVGLAPTLFQSITHMAPAAAVAFSIIVGAPYAGGSLPLAVLLALIACLFVAVSIGQLARHLPSAGGLYTYSSRGLHPWIGFLVAWGFILAEPIVAPLLYLIFGNELAANLNSHFGWPLWLWAPFAVVAGLIVWVLTYRGIRLSTRTGVALGTFEIVVFVALMGFANETSRLLYPAGFLLTQLATGTIIAIALRPGWLTTSLAHGLPRWLDRGWQGLSTRPEQQVQAAGRHKGDGDHDHNDAEVVRHNMPVFQIVRDVHTPPPLERSW